MSNRGVTNRPPAGSSCGVSNRLVEVNNMVKVMPFGSFVCPKCGNVAGADNDNGISRRWYSLRVQDILGINNGKVVTEQNSEENDLPKIEERGHFHCYKCQHEWSTDGIEFTDPYEVEYQRKKQERLGTLEQTHNAMMVCPPELLPGDICQQHGIFAHFTHHSDGPKVATWANFICCHWSDQSYGGKEKDKPILIWRKK